MKKRIKAKEECLTTKKIKNQGAVLEGWLKMSKYSKLELRIFVFNNKKNLKKFWRKHINPYENISNNFLAVTNPLAYKARYMKGGKEYTSCFFDRNYFSVVAFTVDNLTLEIIAHEAAHCAMHYAKRMGPRNIFFDCMELDEEQVCYPVGIITSLLVKFLKDNEEHIKKYLPKNKKNSKDILSIF